MVREITITPVLNGFVCKVGCQKVVFNTVADLALNIRKYYKNPDATEKEFLAEAVNKTNDEPPEAPRPVREESCDRESPSPRPMQESRR